MFELHWTMNAKSLKKLLVIKEIWSWLPPGWMDEHTVTFAECYVDMTSLVRACLASL